MRVRTSGLVLLMLVASAGSAFGQSGTRGISAATVVQVEVQKELPPPAPPAWGTAAEMAVILGAHSGIPASDTVGWNTVLSTTGIGIYQTAATADDWFYQVNVPSGALVTKIVIEGCDNSPSGQLIFKFRLEDLSFGGNVLGLGDAGTGVAATPGCGFFTLTLAPRQIINSIHNIWVRVFWHGEYTAAVRLHSIRVFYKLQVSPAPGSATFADVPLDHPFHRFIEALAASGITGGCGGGNYCPDVPLTRGQMAVFLAVALGLHFPN